MIASSAPPGDVQIEPVFILLNLNRIYSAKKIQVIKIQRKDNTHQVFLDGFLQCLSIDAAFPRLLGASVFPEMNHSQPVSRMACQKFFRFFLFRKINFVLSICNLIRQHGVYHSFL